MLKAESSKLKAEGARHKAKEIRLKAEGGMRTRRVGGSAWHEGRRLRGGNRVSLRIEAKR
jgi:hypothetical protein